MPKVPRFVEKIIILYTMARNSTIGWIKFFKLRRKVKKGFRTYTGDCFTLRQAKILQKCLKSGIPEDEEFNKNSIYARTYCSAVDRRSLLHIPQ